MPRPLSRADIARLAGSLAAVLGDADADLTAAARHRYEGALVALEVALGRNRSVLAPELAIHLESSS
jgi:hypothetical protein